MSTLLNHRGLPVEVDRTSYTFRSEIPNTLPKPTIPSGIQKVVEEHSLQFATERYGFYSVQSVPATIPLAWAKSIQLARAELVQKNSSRKNPLVGITYMTTGGNEIFAVVTDEQVWMKPGYKIAV